MPTSLALANSPGPSRVENKPIMKRKKPGVSSHHTEDPRALRRSGRLQDNGNYQDRPPSSPSKVDPLPARAVNDRKRTLEVETSIIKPRKRLRSSRAPCPVKQEVAEQKYPQQQAPNQESSKQDNFEQGVAQVPTSTISPSKKTNISHWAEEGTWPKEYYKQEIMQATLPPQPLYPLLARQKSVASLRRKRSGSSTVTSDYTLVTPSDQRPREEKHAPYRNVNYPLLLETLAKSFMKDSGLGLTDGSKALCQNLLAKEYTTPGNTLFRDDVFETACMNLQDKNEARIILDIARLITPSAESLAAFGAKHFGVLIETVNEGWNNCITITSTRPQPDFAVGFRRSMFSDKQFAKMEPLLGDFSHLSIFKATARMYFPFLTSEVKCGVVGLDLADRQNCHSMTIAARAIVELFRLAGRESEVHRELLTFSVSHDQSWVRLFGHYPVIDGANTQYYRHKIHAFDITTLNGKEKWTTYNFVMGVYDHSLTLLKKLQSVIDDIPTDFNSGLDDRSKPLEPPIYAPSGVSQHSQQQFMTEIQDSQLSEFELQQVTPDTTTQAETPNSKKQKSNI
ncbi:MAG: hypothetical protein Q9209_006128 [Squamulea sp. 1 TL-2023]